MIPRYEVKEITEIWSDQNRFETMLQVELALLATLEEERVIPTGTTEAIRKSAKIDLQLIYEIEERVKHDIIAFTESITRNAPLHAAKYFHFGVTSSDIIDTALSLQIRQSLLLLLKELSNLKASVKIKIEATQDVLTIGRSHGMYAEPLSFSHKFMSFYAELDRREEELVAFLKNELTASFSGAVGNYTILTLAVEKSAAKKLSLNRESISTQVIPRDKIAKLTTIMGLLSCAIERLVTEIRHLHRSDVAEVSEGFTTGQKGSSTMPHKKNPISTENLTGLMRMLRSYTQVAYENTILWHERDISHSSAERLMLPDMFGIALYAIKRLTKTVDNLEIHQEIIEERVKASKNSLSSFYLHHLIVHTPLSREEIYKLVQEASFASTTPENFKQYLEEKISPTRLPSFTFPDQKRHYTKVASELYQELLQATTK